MGKSVSEATSKEDSAKFVLKEGSENSTDSFIELLSKSGTSEEEYSSRQIFTRNLSLSRCFNDPVKVLVDYGSTVR